jgi:predicted secreted protein
MNAIFSVLCLVTVLFVVFWTILALMFTVLREKALQKAQTPGLVSEAVRLSRKPRRFTQTGWH